MIVGFVMVAARISGLFAIAPIFGSRITPVQIRLGIAVILTVALAPLADVTKPQPTDIVSLVFGIGSEFLFGLAMGFLLQLLFAGVQAAGQFIDLMIGFALANVIDPLSNLQVSVIGQLYNLVAVLTFFAIGGHQMLVMGLARSFDIVPLGKAVPSPELGELLVRGFGDIFLLGLQIGAPIIAALLVTDFFLAVMSRAMPRMNVFFVGFPLRIGVGLIFIGLSMTFVIPFLSDSFNHGFEQMASAIATYVRG